MRTTSLAAALAWLNGMQRARWSLATGAINGKLYAAGGHAEDGTAPHEVYIP